MAAFQWLDLSQILIRNHLSSSRIVMVLAEHIRETFHDII